MSWVPIKFYRPDKKEHMLYLDWLGEISSELRMDTVWWMPQEDIEWHDPSRWHAQLPKPGQKILCRFGYRVSEFLFWDLEYSPLKQEFGEPSAEWAEIPELPKRLWPE